MSDRTGRFLASLGLTLGLVTAGCGQPAPSALPAPSAAASLAPVAACNLVPAIGEAVGREPIASPNGYRVGGNDRCLWVISRDPSRFVGLTVGPLSNHATTVDALGPGESVEGLGDEAIWWASSRTISVAAGDRSFQVDLQLDEPDVTRELAIAIGRQVLAAIAGG